MSPPPAPMVPPDCDLRDFPKMMIDIGRIFASTFNSSASRNPLAWMVAHKLWYRSWHQVPAASLPNDDEDLCHLAELGLDMRSFKKTKPLAMRGWVLCSDGRLYHPVVAEEALGAWIGKLKQRIASGAGNAKRYNNPFDQRPIDAQINVALTMLSALNPQSRALQKGRRREAPAPASDQETGQIVRLQTGGAA